MAYISINLICHSYIKQQGRQKKFSNFNTLKHYIMTQPVNANRWESHGNLLKEYMNETYICERNIFQQNIHKDDVVAVAEKRMYKRTNPHFVCFSLCRPNSKVIPIDCFNKKSPKPKVVTFSSNDTDTVTYLHTQCKNKLPLG